MKTYWDHTEQERSEMSEEMVQKFLDAELMTKGVLKIEPPQLKIIEEVSVEQITMFDVGGVLFKTAEQARIFISLIPYKEVYNWNLGYDHKYPELIGEDIKERQMFTQQGVLNASSVLTRNAESKKWNEKAIEDFNKAKNEMDKVYGGVWEDWNNCLSIANKNRKILSTAKEYLQMTDGDRHLAFNFLQKVYSNSEITAAENWFGANNWPLDIVRSEKLEA